MPLIILLAIYCTNKYSSYKVLNSKNWRKYPIDCMISVHTSGVCLFLCVCVCVRTHVFFSPLCTFEDLILWNLASLVLAGIELQLWRTLFLDSFPLWMNNFWSIRNATCHCIYGHGFSGGLTCNFSIMILMSSTCYCNNVGYWLLIL